MADISLHNLRKSFGTDEVLSGVNLDIRDREFIVILGPSGCGKSTLLRMVAGLETVTGGDIAIDGRSVKGLEPLDRGCAMVFQNYALYPHMTVADNIGYGLRVAGVKRAERMKRVAEVAGLVELSGLLDRKPAQLSGGQRQRVAMGRAIIREPRVFLFDEPLSNLDAKLRVQMRHEVRRIHNRIGATSIFVTHDQVEGMTLADRLVVMNRGVIEQIGTPEEVYERPATSYVAGFIGSPAMNFLPAQVDNDGKLCIENQDSLRLEAPFGDGDSGRTIELGLRPEQIALAAPGQSGLTARFEFSEELGSSRLYHMRLGSRVLSVLSPEKRRITEGDVVAVHIPPHAIHYFDNRTTKRIEPPQ